MVMLDQGPCQNWPLICEDVFPDNTLAISGLAVQAATEILWHKTQRRFGLCELTLRPCRRECWPSWPWMSPGWNDVSGWGWPFPVLIGGNWFNLGCGSCGNDCSCTTLHEAVLPSPVALVVEVKVDGVVLDPSAYRVDDYRLLVRLDNESWPLCNDLNLDDNQPGTWSVTATYGEQVPTLGQFAVGELALEIAKACVGGAGCRLPATTIRQIVRQGVTKTFFSGDVMGGQIGLYWSDLFVGTFNPARSQVAAIFNIDGSRRRHVNT